MRVTVTLTTDRDRVKISSALLLEKVLDSAKSIHRDLDDHQINYCTECRIGILKILELIDQIQRLQDEVAERKKEIKFKLMTATSTTEVPSSSSSINGNKICSLPCPCPQLAALANFRHEIVAELKSRVIFSTRDHGDHINAKQVSGGAVTVTAAAATSVGLKSSRVGVGQVLQKKIVTVTVTDGFSNSIEPQQFRHAVATPTAKPDILRRRSKRTSTYQYQYHSTSPTLCKKFCTAPAAFSHSHSLTQLALTVTPPDQFDQDPLLMTTTTTDSSELELGVAAAAIQELQIPSHSVVFVEGSRMTQQLASTVNSCNSSSSSSPSLLQGDADAKVVVSLSEILSGVRSGSGSAFILEEAILPDLNLPTAPADNPYTRGRAQPNIDTNEILDSKIAMEVMEEGVEVEEPFVKVEDQEHSAIYCPTSGAFICVNGERIYEDEEYPEFQDLNPSESSIADETSEISSGTGIERMGAGADQPFQCHLCPRTFSKKFNLQRHILTHSRTRGTTDKAEPVFVCVESEGLYSADHSGENVEDSEAIVTEDAETATSKTTETSIGQCQGQGESDLGVNNPNNSFRCKFCPKSFTQSESLDRHNLWHAGDKPFFCTFCKSRFKADVNLQAHLLVHAAERPFECKFCSKRFSSRKNVARHEMCHTGEKRFECKFCPYKSIQKVTLQQHVRRYHPAAAESESVGNCS